MRRVLLAYGGRDDAGLRRALEDALRALGGSGDGP